MHNAQRRSLLKATAAFGLIGGLGASAPIFAAAKIKPAANSALIVVDVQNCFIDGGTLPVKGGAEVVPVINKLAGAFENIVVTQDWHTAGHASFASTHAGKKPFETTKLTYGTQVQWLRNLEASGGARMVRQGRALALSGPVRLHGEDGARLVPAAIRAGLRLMRVDDFVEVTVRAHP